MVRRIEGFGWARFTALECFTREGMQLSSRSFLPSNCLRPPCSFDIVSPLGEP